MFCPWSWLVTSRPGVSLSLPCSRFHLPPGLHSLPFLEDYLESRSLFQYPSVRRCTIILSQVSFSESGASSQEALSGLFFSHKFRTPAQLLPYPAILTIHLSSQPLTLQTPYLFGLPDNTNCLFFSFSFFVHCHCLWLLPKVLIPHPVSYEPLVLCSLKWRSKLIFSVMDPDLILKNTDRGIHIFDSWFQWGWCNSGFYLFLCA